jgi:hypothetical protein
MSRSVRVVSIVVGVLLLFVLAIVIGKKQGAETGAETLARLELVWPSFMRLSSTDRALLAGFSMTCHLEREPQQPAEVLACLRSAAADPDAIKPKGMGWAEAAARLEVLIDTAQEK